MAAAFAVAAATSAGWASQDTLSPGTFAGVRTGDACAAPKKARLRAAMLQDRSEPEGCRGRSQGWRLPTAAGLVGSLAFLSRLRRGTCKNVATAARRLAARKLVAAAARTSARAEGGAATGAATPSSTWKGAKMKPLALCVAAGLFIRFVIPVPAGVPTEGWSILALFVATVLGIVTQPLPAPGVAFVAVAVGLFTGTLTFKEGISAFTDEVLWLVLLAFFFTRGFAKTGLGDRIALNIVRAVGSTTLGLAYGLNLAEGALAAAMPSSAARAAGVFYPLALSVAKASGSDPAQGTEKKTGAFLIQSSFQATGQSSSLWLYGAAQNLLALRLASQCGYSIGGSQFTAWLKATSVPAAVAMLLTPLLVYKVLPPEVSTTPEAPAEAKRKLEEMGPVSRDEVILASTIVGMLILWAGSSTFGIPAVSTAVLGLSVLLCFGTITWNDCASEKGAWTTMTWFAILVSMSAQLNQRGIVSWLATTISSKISAAGLSSAPAFVLLLMMYTFSHYAFASQVAHLSALYVPFIAMMVKTGTPPAVAVLALAISSNVFGSLTPYASAQAPVFYGGGYVTLKDWYKLGLIFIIFNLMVWGGVGAVWWKVLGLY